MGFLLVVGRRIKPQVNSRILRVSLVVVTAMLASPLACVNMVKTETATILNGRPGFNGQSPDEDRSGCVVKAPPYELEFDPFYSKYCDAAGIPIISSASVEERALGQAYYLVMNILTPIPQVRKQLIYNGA